MRLTKGYVLWQGLSMLDRKTEVAMVATCVGTPSSNPKTGDTIQVFFLVVNENPWEAVINGMDEGVCGNCIHRRVNKGT
tara:strand:- start:467 stop:703 length:237 start_codon:yes stop_codon:yes gene_type:complete